MSVSKFLPISLLLAATAVSTPAQAGNYTGPYSVEINKTEIVRLSEPASAVIIGNPKIADVSVHSSDTIFVVGRGYGQTNLIIMNGSGQTIMNADIQVTGSKAPGNIRVFSGNKRESFSCAPYCLPAPVLGDNLEFIVTNTPDVPSIQTTTITGTSSAPESIVGMAVPSEPEFSEDDPRRPYFPE